MNTKDNEGKCREFFVTLGGFYCDETRDRHCHLPVDICGCDLAHHPFRRQHHVNADSAKRFAKQAEESR